MASYNLRQVANGWVVTEKADFACEAEMFVFETVKELAEWLAKRSGDPSMRTPTHKLDWT